MSKLILKNINNFKKFNYHYKKAFKQMKIKLIKIMGKTSLIMLTTC
jgi:hypothetical protein